ncbi:MAG: Gfo/Idh/MocA family oxidoreductase [Verrucomicrobia bacterium]|nr:Gfo/Idh/MocA family oxidoreductase [Verrucomicrobiota bacterium]
MIKAAIVGAGCMGTAHADGIRQIPGIELAAVADLIPDKAKTLAERFGGTAVGTAEAIYADDSIDLVICTTSTESHKTVCLRALEAGKHVFCEKPIARRLDEGIEMAQAARRAKGKAMVGHVLRYLPEYAALKCQLDAGRIGTPAVVRTERNLYVPKTADNWFVDFDRSGGVLYDLAIHDMDFCMACFGPVERVYAKGLMTSDAEVPDNGDYALVTLRFRSGVIAHIEASWLYSAGFYMAFEASGSAGILEYDSRTTRPLVFCPAGGDAKERVGAELPQSPFRESGYVTELRLLVEAIRNDAEPPISFDFALDVLRVADAAERSVRTGEAVAPGAEAL